MSKKNYCEQELEVVKRLWADLYNIPGRFHTDEITIDLHVHRQDIDDFEFEEKEIIEDALWLYIKYLEQLIKENHGNYQSRSSNSGSIKDMMREYDEQKKVAEEYG